MSYQILSMDGGGIRGVLTAQILDYIVAEFPSFLDDVDLIAGTSAGALNTIALTFPQALTPAQLVNVYEHEGRNIFHSSLPGALNWGLVSAKYGTPGRRNAMIDSLNAVGNTHSESVTLGQLKKNVLICTFQLDSQNPISPSTGPRDWKPKLFHNFPFDNGGVPNTDTSVSAIDVATMSSAAPVVFPIFEGFVDGGVFANNPVMCAIAQALNIGEFTGGQVHSPDVKDLRVVSIGTGAGKRQFLTEKDNSWGITEWGFKIIDLLVDSVTGVADYQATQLLDACYQRINPVMDSDIGLDDVEKVPTLLAIAKAWRASPAFAELIAWLQAKWEKRAV